MLYEMLTEPGEFLMLGNERVFRKQLIYRGDFVKKQPGRPDLPFSVYDGTINHWHNMISKFSNDGVEIPIMKGHTFDPDKKRGTLVGSETGWDKKGRWSLFGYVKFAPEYEHLAASNVSIFTPKDWYGYKWPIQHVASTDDPVIQGLEPFESIALSLELDNMTFPGAPAPAPAPVAAPPAAPPPAPAAVTVQSIAAKLGIPPTTPPDQILAQIDAKITAMTAAKPPAPPAVPAAPKPAIMAGYAKLASQLRNTQVDGLVNGGHITPAAAVELKKQYCTDEQLSLSLAEDGTSTDGFDSLMATLRLNQAIPMGTSSGLQLANAPALNRQKLSDNPLIRDAEQKAEEHKRARS